jgi:hypothetical protein
MNPFVLCHRVSQLSFPYYLCLLLKSSRFLLQPTLANALRPSLSLIHRSLHACLFVVLLLFYPCPTMTVMMMPRHSLVPFRTQRPNPLSFPTIVLCTTTRSSVNGVKPPSAATVPSLPLLHPPPSSPLNKLFNCQSLARHTNNQQGCGPLPLYHRPRNPFRPVLLSLVRSPSRTCTGLQSKPACGAPLKARRFFVWVLAWLCLFWPPLGTSKCLCRHMR